MSPPRLAQQSSSVISAGSSTVTIEQSGTLPLRQGTPALILRAEPAEQRHIQWAEDVIDNEGMGKKSSKVCCIYHRPHAVDESSGDESSDSSDSSESDSGDDGRARPAGGSRRSCKSRKPHDHDHDGGDCGKENGKGKGKARKRSPNAYEKQPKYPVKKADGSV